MYYTTNTKSLFYKGIYLSRKNLYPKLSFASQSNYHNLLEKKLKQAVGRAKRKSEIATNHNIYKDSLNDFIDTLNTESSDWPHFPD